MPRTFALIALALLTGCATHPADVAFDPLHLVSACPTESPALRVDDDVVLQMVGTPGHRLLGCGTLYVQTLQVHVPAGWRVLRWERVPGAWTYAFLLRRPDGTESRRVYELATLARKHRFHLEPTVEVRAYRAPSSIATTPRQPCCPHVFP